MEGGQRFDSALAHGFRKDAGLPAAAGELAEKGGGRRAGRGTGTFARAGFAD